MESGSVWWAHTEFVGDYYFGKQRKVARQLAAYLARYYVGEQITELRPDTDVSALIGDSIRRRIDIVDFTMVREPSLFDDLDFKESVSFNQLVLRYTEREPPSSPYFR